jgi:lysophospholipase L1-like esterase
MLYQRQKVYWFLFGLILIGVTIVCAEAGLRLAAELSRQVDIFTRRQPLDCFIHDANGFYLRGNPYCPDHDARGYRNRRALSEAEIVTLGDSWTYGAGVSSDAAWPYVLSERLNRPVYNMGVPGTGPLQSQEILRRALQLHPKVIIFGFYFGNDLLDDFFFAEKNERLSEFLPANDISEITQAEQAEDLKAKVDVLFTRAMPADPPQPEDLSTLARIKSFIAHNRIRSFIADNSRLYGFLRSLKKLWFDAPPRELAVLDPRYEDAVAGILDYQQPYVTPFSEGGWKTVFTSPYRFAVVDLADVRVRAGLSIAKQTMLTMNQICKDNGINFIVALLPTKETIFRKKVSDVFRYKLYSGLVNYEDEIRTELKAFFKEHLIDFVDPLPRLQEADVQPNFENADGHPNVAGQEIIAAAIYDFIKENRATGASRATAATRPRALLRPTQPDY